MGRLDVHIRHGGGGDGAGPWAALAVLVALAIIGGAARHLIGDVAHVLVTVLEVIGWTLAAIASAAVAGGGCWPASGSGARCARPAPAAPCPSLPRRSSRSPPRGMSARCPMSPVRPGPRSARPRGDRPRRGRCPAGGRRSARGSAVTAMSTAPGDRPARQAPGVVRVRLAGDLPALAALASVLAAVPCIEILPAPMGPTRTAATRGRGST